MPAHFPTLEKNGRTFAARVYIGDTECVESVYLITDGRRECIHCESFPKSNLGNADTEEYARVMLASIADQWFRDNR